MHSCSLPLFWVSIAVINTRTKSNLGRRALFWLTVLGHILTLKETGTQTGQEPEDQELRQEGMMPKVTE